MQELKNKKFDASPEFNPIKKKNKNTEKSDIEQKCHIPKTPSQSSNFFYVF